MKKILTLLVVAMVSFIGANAQPRVKGPVAPMKNTSAAASFTYENLKSTNYLPLVQGPKKAKFGGTDGFVDAYSFILYDNRFRSYVLSKFNTEDPTAYKRVRDYGTTQGSDVFQTATFVGDRIFAERCYLQWMGYWQPRSFGWLDPETTEFEEVFSWTDSYYTLFRDMTYDPVSDKIYLIDAEDGFEVSHIYMIDPNNPQAPEKVCTMNYGLTTIAADNGYLYGIIPNSLDENNKDQYGLYQPKANTRLVKINTASINKATQTCEVEEIRASGMNISIAFNDGQNRPSIYWQSMEFDKINHRLWWMTTTHNGQALAIEINHKTGSIISRTNFTTNPQMIALAIPYQTAADGAPSYVRNLNVTPGAQGASLATFTWDNPSQTYMNENLTQLTGIKVYRDGELIQTIPSFTPGLTMLFEDTDVPTGNHNYKFLPYNNAGDGIYKDIDVFVGHDTPAKVDMLTLVAEGTGGKITWNAPTEGRYGGWIDASTLKYKIVRLPDNVTVAEDLTATSFVDNNITRFDGYSYVVTPSTADGEGESATSNVLPLGPALDVPYTSALNTQQLFNMWTVIDNNQNGLGDGVSWEFDAFRKVARYYGNLNQANDYLISPKFNFEPGKEYQIRYTYYSMNWVHPVTMEPLMEEMEVYYGTEPTAEGMNQLLFATGEFNTGSEIYLYGKNNFTPQTTTGHVAFKSVTPGDRGITFLKDFSIREHSTTDLSVTKVNISGVANANVLQEANVEVTNEGTQTQSNYTVQIIDAETEQVLGTANGVSVNPDEHVNVKVGWMPTVAGNMNLTARVVLEGDTYPEDNTWKSPVVVNVTESDGVLWFAANEDHKRWDEGYNDWLGIGWNGPMHLTYNYSQVQNLFLESELRKDVILEGLQFVYDGNAGLKGMSFGLKVSIKKTDRTSMENVNDAGMGDFDPSSGWTVVFDGEVTFESASENSPMTIMFDTPFKYESGNIIVKYERTTTGAIDGEIAPYWHFYQYGYDKPRRLAFYHGNSTNVNSDMVFTDWECPHTRFAYSLNPESVKGTENAGLTIAIDGNNLSFGKACNVEVFNTAGARVMSAKGVNRINTRSLAKGIYTVRATIDGKVINKKIAVK